jgi:hypothetical protein
MFSFGCSFTQYVWPSWADLLGQSYDHYENWGVSGSGNPLIYSRLLQCNAVNKITKDDHVFVMLSSISRIDSYNTRWYVRGNILNAKLGPKEDWWVRNRWSIEQAFHDSWVAINGIKIFLESIGCEYKIMKAFNIAPDEHSEYLNMFTISNEKFKNIYTNDIADIVDIDEPMYNWSNNIGNFYKFKLEKNDDGTPIVDHHPSIKNHHDWCELHLSKYYTNKVDVQSLEPALDLTSFNTCIIRNFHDKIKINHINPSVLI